VPQRALSQAALMSAATSSHGKTHPAETGKKA